MARKKPIKILTLDTETYNGLLGDLKRIAIYDGERVIYGYSFLEIEKEILKYCKSYTVHIYIHNAEFDLRKMPEIFDKSRIDWGGSFIINGKLATVKTKKYTIHDSLKLLPMSLKKLSKDFDVEHGKLNLFDAIIERYGNEFSIYKDNEVDENATLVNFLDKCDVDDELYLQYLGYDVISLYEILMKIIDIAGIDIDVFVKRVSTASLSRYLFKNGWKGKQFKPDLNTRTDYEQLCLFNYYDDLLIENFLRESYCGGRTEVFKPFLNGAGYHYDVNSLYPFVMYKNIEKEAFAEYPIGKPEYYNNSHSAKEYFEDWQQNKIGLGFVHALVYVPKQHIPPLPVKMGKLVFPCGEIYGVWTYEELDFAIRECGVEVREFFAVCHYRNTYPVFKNFVETFYTLKEQATEEQNESLRSFAKLLLNVGYGYTGMSRDKTQLKDISELEKYCDEVININEELGFIEIPSDIRAEYIQVAVASYVTSRARLVLLKALKDCDSRGNVYYCDTDSVVTDVPLPEHMVNSTKLGMWDLETEPYKALFLRPKVYAEIYDKKGEEKTNVKFKGVSKDTQATLNFEYYNELFNELKAGEKDSILVEKNKMMFRSIMYMEKNNIDFSHVEYRDKKMNLNNVEKRKMDFVENYTEPLYFESYEAFKSFRFKQPKKIVEF